MNFDPAIALPFRKAMDRDIVLWKQYDAVRCPTLLLRGAQSDLLLRETALEMTQRGPKPKLIEFAGPCAGADGGRPDRRGARLSAGDLLTFAELKEIERLLSRTESGEERRGLLTRTNFLLARRAVGARALRVDEDYFF